MSRDPTMWMWAQACEMLEQAEGLRRRFFQVYASAASRPAWEPPIDMIETAALIKITVVLPGVEPQSIQVVASGDALVVTGERSLAIEPGSAVIHRLEIPYGRFERRIPLPRGSFRLGELRHVDGCLIIPLHKDG